MTLHVYFEIVGLTGHNGLNQRSNSKWSSGPFLLLLLCVLIQLLLAQSKQAESDKSILSEDALFLSDVPSSFSYADPGAARSKRSFDYSNSDDTVHPERDGLVKSKLPSTGFLKFEPCGQSGFECLDRKKCIPQAWVCDYSPDCDDGSDEENCEPRTCTPRQFQCASTLLCIPLGWVCDGEPDCGLDAEMKRDSSDEDVRKCNKGFACPKNYFRCNDGITCRRIVQLCDGVKDCPDFSDEGSFCENKTMCEGNSCKYGCRPGPVGPLCFCAMGEEPSDGKCVDSELSSDTNECHIEGTCDQICHNTPGSHECSCVGVYRQEGRHCYGINVSSS
ncbi:prolow-density lipoprotein receptor-related protein 1-like [Limulus polyphemus]|uniref:Prolow-density lipoprotein receptor-related protein 1-like n=1 Tax=Limulus polyphemus TaxID=6850 RepID=A0ABM1T2D0_LIMPO|nr:prolow-density lipoprotein receptor-related protein 1-like [Limulus polyphemus]